MSQVGDVYVCDNVAGCVKRFTSGGVYIQTFGPGGPLGGLTNPYGVAVDNAGNVYVADTFRHRIVRFSWTGTFDLSWGTQGTGDGQFSYPYGVAIDPKGDVYVADTYNHRVQKFHSDGAYVKQWGGQGTGDGQFDFCQAICVDLGGNVYVADANNHRVQRFTPHGRLLSIWGSVGSGPGEFGGPSGVATGRNGDVYVCDSNNQRIQVFRRRQGQGHRGLTAWGSDGVGNGLFSGIGGVAASADGYVYVADPNANTIQKFTSFGQWVTAWGSNGSGNGQFQSPTGVALDSGGNVYVADVLNHRIQKFSSSGAYLGQWGSNGAGTGQFTGLWDIAIDASDNVYVVDANRVQRFTTAGTFVNAWSCPNARGIGVDAEGMVYVACNSDDVVRKFAPDGSLVLEWGSLGSGIGQFQYAIDVVCDPQGYVYVVDAADRVQQFTPMGGYLEEWGEPGSDINQVSGAIMMAADPSGSLYITEWANHRVHKFASPPEITAIEDVPADQGGYVRITFTPSSAEASPGGELYQYRVLRFNPPNGVVAANFLPGPTSVVVPSGGNTTDAFDGVGEYELIGLLAVPNAFPLQYSSYGFSTDDVPPPAPDFFFAAYSYDDGATHLHWSPSSAPGFKEYRLFKGAGPSLSLRATEGGISWTPLATQTDTGYADVGPPGGFYRVEAVDTVGNVGAPLSVGPDETIDVPAPSTLSFALEGAAPNPASSSELRLRFTLPDAKPARLELVNVAGRSVWSRIVEGVGPHALRPAIDIAPGIYFVRLTRGEQSLVRRAVVLD